MHLVGWKAGFLFLSSLWVRSSRSFSCPVGISPTSLAKPAVKQVADGAHTKGGGEREDVNEMQEGEPKQAGRRREQQEQV